PAGGLRDLGGVVGNGDHGDAAAGRPGYASRRAQSASDRRSPAGDSSGSTAGNAPRTPPAAGAAGRIALLLNCLGMSHAAPLQIAVESCGHHSNKRTPCRQNHYFVVIEIEQTLSDE